MGFERHDQVKLNKRRESQTFTWIFFSSIGILFDLTCTVRLPYALIAAFHRSTLSVAGPRPSGTHCPKTLGMLTVLQTLSQAVAEDISILWVLVSSAS